MPLDGVGQLVPALLVDPDGLAFGDQTVGTTGSPLMLHLTNDGTADLHISAASAGDVNGSDFTLTGGSCLPAGGPVVVTPDESCDLQVRFRPAPSAPARRRFCWPPTCRQARRRSRSPGPARRRAG